MPVSRAGWRATNWAERPAVTAVWWILMLAAVMLAVTLFFGSGKASAEIATFYSDNLAGRPMAWGEPYRPERPTCAHRTLPRHAMLKLTYRGRVAFCRVTDRGPWIAGRHIDVSRAVASRLGMIRQGVARVHVERIG